MYNDFFFHKLALERCQHSLAQLSATLFAAANDNSDREHTIITLIEHLNRDLGLLRRMAEDREESIMADDQGKIVQL